MLARHPRAFTPPLVCLALSLLVSACEKVPLLAPTGSTITLVSAATALPVNGSASIIAQVIEAAGTPPHSGTSVTFTTTLGSIQPSTATTDVSGSVTVTFLAGASNGIANINAISGGATTGTAGAIKIAIGTASVGGVRVGANPTSISSFGGSSTITANIFDINGNVLPGVPVSFTTSAGSLTLGTVTSDSNGAASTTLTTTQQAVVTATVGATGATTPPTTGTTPGTGTTTPTTGQQSGSVTISVIATPTLVITPPATPPSVGLPAAFTFAVTNVANGAVAKSVTVDWGDGSAPQPLGTVSGNAVVSHVFASARTYVISATMADTAGNTTLTSTSVTVIPVPRPTIIVTQSPNPGHANTVTTLSIQITLPNGIGVDDLKINFGDNSVCGCDSTADLGGATSASEPHTYTAAGTYTISITVRDTSGQTTTGTAVVSIGV